jgi:hypothetical protein
MEANGLKINIIKIKVMISGNIERTEKWTRAVCGMDVRSNSMQFIGCDGWLRKRSKGVRG